MKERDALKYAEAAELLVEEGDYEGARVASWIAYLVARASDSLPTQTRLQLARAAASAADVGGTSLSMIATRVVDPLLIEATSGQLDLDVGEVEWLNFARRRIQLSVARHGFET
jgi:hypothetical protein